MAEEANLVLAEVASTTAREAMAQRIDEALRAREVVAHAVGILMGRQRTDAAGAAAVLARKARASGRTVHAVAADLVASVPVEHGRIG